MEQPLKLPEISTVLKKILCSYVGYYDGTLNGFELSSSGELTLKQVSEQNGVKKFPLLIVARSFYSEQARSYPIENKKDLNKLLKLEFSSSKRAVSTFFHVWSDSKHVNEKSSTQSAVNIWQFEYSVPAAYLTLPESLLLAVITKANQVLTINSNKPSYVARADQLIHSLTKTPVVTTTQRFAMSAGIAELLPTQVVNVKSLPSAIALGLKELPLQIIASFIKRPEINSRFELIKNIALPALAVITLYLASTSGYLTCKKYSLQQLLSAQREDVSTALAQQIDFDKKSVRYNALQKFTAAQENSTPFWLIMAELFPSAQFINIRMNKERFVLRGTAIKAIGLLENLTKYKQVSDAKFDFPVRNNRGKEAFVISFKLTNIQKSNKVIEQKREQKTKQNEALLKSGGTHG